MDEPNNIAITIRILSVVIFGLIVPQLLGVVGYVWAKTKKKILKAFTLIIAPLVFFGLSNLYWRSQAESIRETGNYVCGAFGAAAVFSTIYGTIIHFVLGILIFLAMSYVLKKRKEKVVQQATH